MRQEIAQILPGLRRFAYSLTGSMPDADDVLQSTVERLLAREVPEDADIGRWAFRVCRNVWIDECRARKVRRDAAERPELSEGQVVQGEQETSSEIELNRVEQAMARLPEDQRQIIALVALQGFSYGEVAEILAIRKGTVMSRLARARAALSELLKAASPETLP